MSKIQIKQLEKTSSEIKDLNYWETKQVVGGLGATSSQEIMRQAIQDALNRVDISRNSTP